nr:MAG TPA: hypothetical protein [Caudoviricetes sp.]
MVFIVLRFMLQIFGAIFNIKNCKLLKIMI